MWQCVKCGADAAAESVAAYEDSDGDTPLLCAAHGGGDYPEVPDDLFRDESYLDAREDTYND